MTTAAVGAELEIVVTADTLAASDPIGRNRLTNGDRCHSVAPLASASLRRHMAGTATIRVDRDVRDQLARAAERNGISLAGLLRRYAREQMIESERAARVQADQIPGVSAEQDGWDSTVGDGIT